MPQEERTAERDTGKDPPPSIEVHPSSRAGLLTRKPAPGSPASRPAVNSPLKNSISGRLFKNDEMQGARILRNEAYIQYAAMTKDEASRQRRERKSRFSTAC